MAPKPEADTDKLACEIKAYLEKNWINLVDYGYWNIQTYPDPQDDTYPELKKFAGQWDEFFKHADEVFPKDGFPTALADEFEAVTRSALGKVNDDTAFWEQMRKNVLPMYDRSKEKEKWQERWKSINFFYYPEPLHVKTTGGYAIKNIKTGQIRKRVLDEVITDKVMPPGFVIEIR